MKTKRFLIGLALIITTSLVLAQMKISQYPNTATPANGDLFLLASGSTNKNISWQQLMSLWTNLASMTVTDLTAINFEATNLNVVSNLNLGGNTVYSLYTNTTPTNVTVNMEQSIQFIGMTTNLTLLQTTNRPTTGTNVLMTLLVVDNYSGTNFTINTNPATGWRVYTGDTFPYTASNGVRHTFSFMSIGPYESNVNMGTKPFK